MILKSVFNFAKSKNLEGLVLWTKKNDTFIFAIYFLFELIYLPEVYFQSLFFRPGSGSSIVGCSHESQATPDQILEKLRQQEQQQQPEAQSSVGNGPITSPNKGPLDLDGTMADLYNRQQQRKAEPQKSNFTFTFHPFY